MTEAVETMEGWYCLHDLRTIDWKKWKKAPEAERKSALQGFEKLIADWELVDEKREGSHALYQAVGHKADLMFMFLRPTMEELASLETALDKSKLGDYLIRAHSYLSVVELGKHRAQQTDGDPKESPEVQERLYPSLPKWNYMSFYPMSRRRAADANWFTLEQSERSKLLYEHSLTGRQYLNKVQQVTTGSIGLDKWEWAITLFSHEAVQLKKIVYEMRFDEASSRFGEFGDFFIGIRLEKDKVENYFSL